jgi:hypothetical protein
MKQSTKLLSLVLALVMAFSCMTVIGNAALVDGKVKYDSVDDAALTNLPEAITAFTDVKISRKNLFTISY